MLYDPHLDTFLQVARLGSFSRAAEANYITPSAVIKQINLLESDLGVRLFNRSHHGLTLTAAGETLLHEAPRLIVESRAIEARVSAAAGGEANVIRIGSSPITPAEVLVELWPRLSKIMPDLKFQMIPFENSPENARMILKNLGTDIDVVAGIFDDRMLDHRECNGMKLSDEKLCVSLSVNHPLARKARLTISDLHGQELMMIQRGNMSRMDALRDYLESEHPQIKIVDFPIYKVDVFNECQNSGRMLVTVERWRTVHPLLKTVRMGWKYDIPYGLLYSKTPDQKVVRFLTALQTIIRPSEAAQDQDA